MQLSPSAFLLLQETNTADTIAQDITGQKQAPPHLVQPMPLAIEFEIFTCAAFILIAVFIWFRSRLILTSMEMLKATLRESFRNEASRLAPKPAQHGVEKTGKLDQDYIRQIDALLNTKFNNLYQEWDKDRDQMMAAIERLSAVQTETAQPRQVILAAAAGANSTSVVRPTQNPEVSFVSELVQDYNSVPDREFNDKYGAKPAQLQEKGGTRLGLHDAGSFSVVESAGGRCYALPRPRTLTRTGHESTGFQILFRYKGYDPKKSEIPFCLETPAVLSPDSGSGWSLKEPGLLRLKTEEN